MEYITRRKATYGVDDISLEPKEKPKKQRKRNRTSKARKRAAAAGSVAQERDMKGTEQDIEMAEAFEEEDTRPSKRLKPTDVDTPSLSIIALPSRPKHGWGVWFFIVQRY